MQKSKGKINLLKLIEQHRKNERQQTAQEIFEDLFNVLKYNYQKEDEACVYFTDIEKIKQKYLGDKK